MNAWLATFLLSHLFGSTAALAEVCDKAVGDDWSSKDGPVWLLNPAGFPVRLVLLVAGFFLVGALRLRWLGYTLAGLWTVFVMVLVFADLVPEHDMYLMEIREGCRAFRTDVLDAILMGLFVAGYVWLGRRVGRRPAAIG